MSSSGVGAEASVTLTLADTQGLLSGGLDTVTLNIASQVSSCVPPAPRGRPGELITFLSVCSEYALSKLKWFFLIKLKK